MKDDALIEFTFGVLFVAQATQFMTLQLYLLLNTLLNFDVYRMIIDPFTPPRLRVRSYYMYIVIVVLVIILLYVI